MDSETLTHVSLSIASFVYIIIAFINTAFQFHMSRERELKLLVAEAVSYVWLKMVKDTKGTTEWNNISKQNAETTALEYVKARSICVGCVASDPRLRMWIKDSVERNKYNVRRLELGG